MSARNKVPMIAIVITIVLIPLLVVHSPSTSAGSATHTVSARGNAKIDTSQSKFGGASGFFDGSGDYLSTPDSNDWYFGTGDFTIDFWTRFNVFPSNNNGAGFFSQYTDTSHFFRFELFIDGGGNKYWRVVVDGSSVPIQVGTTLTTNAWYHVALVRSGNNWHVFQDGVQIGSTATSGISISDYSGLAEIGRIGHATYYLNGWLDEYRVSKGVARWTSSFGAPIAPYTADSYTVLLLHMDGTAGSTTFTDDSLYIGPASFSFNARAGATQIVVTLTYSWSGSGSLPLGSISIAGPGGTPVLDESGAIVYDRTSIAVSGSTNTYSIIHRATFTVSISSAQTWTAQISLSGVSNYNLAIEVV